MCNDACQSALSLTISIITIINSPNLVYFSGTWCDTQQKALLVLGGWNRNCSFVYNAATDTWYKAASMSQYRSSTAAAIWNGTVVVAGGFDRLCNTLKSTEQYNPKTNSWSAFEPMLTCRWGLALVAFENNLFAIGGNDDKQQLGSVERYDKVNKNWSLAPDLNQCRDATCAASSSVSQALMLQKFWSCL